MPVKQFKNQLKNRGKNGNIKRYVKSIYLNRKRYIFTTSFFYIIPVQKFKIMNNSTIIGFDLTDNR